MNMKKIYKKIAKKYGVSVETVKQEMEKSIAFAYENPQDSSIKLSQEEEASKSGPPSVEEFILCAAKLVKK